jgi:transposase-like protein
MDEDYPKNMLEMEQRFGTEDACRQYLIQLRWPNGFVCPACQGKTGWLDRRHRWICQECRRQSAVTAGTIFEGIHLPLRVWFRAAWLVTSQKSGASALGMQRVLGLGSYETAWSWLHKFRRAMVRPGRDRLTGTVEVDEAFIGGVTPGAPGRDGGGIKPWWSLPQRKRVMESVEFAWVVCRTLPAQACTVSSKMPLRQAA